MSFTREITIWYDFCAEWSQECVDTPTEARSDLRKRGWRRSKQKDYCPACAKKHGLRKRSSDARPVAT